MKTIKTELQAKILELKQNGLSHGKISNLLNCSKSTVSVTCKNYKMKNNVLLKNISDNTIREILKMRKLGSSYKEIRNKIDIKEDQLIFICRYYNLNNSNFYRKPLDTEIIEMQKYYDECQSTRKVGEKFGWSKSTVGKYLSINTSNKNKLSLEEYKKKRKKDLSIAVVDWRRRTKIKLVEYKGGCCEICGYKKSINALEFHHINPNEKDFTISAKSYSYERLKNEVDKCILVCSNCHIEMHEEIKNKKLEG